MYKPSAATRRNERYRRLLLGDEEGGGGPTTDPYWDNVILLLNFEGDNGDTTTVDESNSANVVTFAGTSQISTAQSKIGDSSLLLDGNSDYLTIPDSADWFMDEEDFTIEAWIYWSNAPSSGQQSIIGQSASSSNNAFAFEWYSSDMRLVGSQSGASMSPKLAKVDWNSTPGHGQWHHVSFCRNGAGAYGHINGVGGLAQGWTLPVYNSTSTVKIGSRGGTKFYFDGHIDSLRFTKGVARYEAGVSYTPNTEAFPTS